MHQQCPQVAVAALADASQALPAARRALRRRQAEPEPAEFLGYRIGRNYGSRPGWAFIGTRPSRESVRSICRKVSEMTQARYRLPEPELVVARLNRALLGSARYFRLGQVSRAYQAIDSHATKQFR